MTVIFEQLWVCQDCSAAIENGDGVQLPIGMAHAGLMQDEHTCGVEVLSPRAVQRYLRLTPEGDRPGWNCAVVELSRRSCDGCGTRLDGDRLAYVTEVK